VNPPRIAVRLLYTFASPVVAGDLIEAYRKGDRSPWWFWRQTFAAVRPGGPMDKRLSTIALIEWVLVLPAAVVVSAAMVRLMGGRGIVFRVAQSFFDWSGANLHRPIDAAVMFLLLPLLGLLLGASTLMVRWRSDSVLRSDMTVAANIARRNVAIGLLMGATCVGAAIFGATVLHMITD